MPGQAGRYALAVAAGLALAVTRNRPLVVVAGGKRATALRAGGAPAWSPDGSRIAFTRDDGATLSVVVRDLASGEERVIERGFAMDPAFSADGAAVCATAPGSS